MGSQSAAIEAWFSFHAGENVDTDRDRRWAAWIERAERSLEIDSLDGDQSTDGFCIDLAYDAFCGGQSAEDYAAGVRTDPLFASVPRATKIVGGVPLRVLIDLDQRRFPRPSIWERIGPSAAILIVAWLLFLAYLAWYFAHGLEFVA